MLSVTAAVCVNYFYRSLLSVVKTFLFGELFFCLSVQAELGSFKCVQTHVVLYELGNDLGVVAVYAMGKIQIQILDLHGNATDGSMRVSFCPEKLFSWMFLLLPHFEKCHGMIRTEFYCSSVKLNCQVNRKQIGDFFFLSLCSGLRIFFFRQCVCKNQLRWNSVNSFV